MKIRYGRVLKLFALTSLSVSMLTACNTNLFERKNSAPDPIVEATATSAIRTTSKVIDFKIITRQNMAYHGDLSDLARSYPQLAERAQMLATVDHVFQTESGQWQFTSNYKQLFTMVSPDGQSLQVINSADPMFNTVTVKLDKKTHLAEAFVFNLSDCQYASTDACDRVDAIIYVQTADVPQADQGTGQDQGKDQDKDQDQSQDKDQDQSQDKDQDKDQGQGGGQTPPTTSGTVSVRF